MAATFNGVSHCDGPSPGGINNYSMTVACWFRVGTSQNKSLVSITDRTELDSYYELGIRSDGNVTAVRRQVDWLAAFGPTTFSLGEWRHAAAVYLSETEWYAALDGVKGATVSHPVVQSINHDTLAIGKLIRSTPAGSLIGDVAEVAVWDKALPESALKALAAGLTPLALQAHASELRYYRGLGRGVESLLPVPATSVVGGVGWTRHPPVVSPSISKSYVPSRFRRAYRPERAVLSAAGASAGAITVAGAVKSGVSNAGEVW